MRIFTALFLTISCAACTSPIKVVRVNPSDSATRTGVAYHLSYTRFNVAIKRMVKACGPGSITLVTNVEASLADPAIDPDQEFTIDPNSMAGIFRISAVKADYGKGGLVKSLNASAEDRLVQTLSAAVAGVIKLATLPVAVGTAGITPVPACSQSTLDALKALPQAVKDLTQASNKLELESSNYKSIQDRVTALGGIVDESTRRSLFEARVRSDTAAVSLVDKKAIVDRLKEALSHTETFYWPRSGSEFQALRPAPDNLLNLWKNTEFTASLPKPPNVHLRLVVDVGQPNIKPTPISSSEPVQGLPYRMPRSGYLIACDGDCSPANLLTSVSAQVLQLGTHYYLPCQSQTFGSTACTFTVDENGLPTSAGTEKKVAAAENAAAAFKDLATQYSTLRETRRDFEKVAYEAATARLKAKAEYEKALASPPPLTELQLLNEQTALLKGYVDYYAAMKAYNDAKNAVEPGNP